MHLLISTLFVWTLILIAALWACVTATWIYFRLSPTPPLETEILPMTVVKPVRGLDEAMLPGLEALVRADPQSRLQILVAMESAEDPAYTACRDFAAAHPGRDIDIIISGPARGRMGKIHNMIAALPRAKHPRVIFSDADTIALPEVLAETSAAFARGFDAIYAIPYHLKTDDLSGYLMQIAFGHGFSVAVALGYYLRRFNFYAGAWMAYTTDLLGKIGGLEPFARVIADDYAVGDAASKAGSRKYLLHSRIGVQESDRTLKESLRHLAKWSAIIRSSLPGVYALLPLFDGVLTAAAVLALDIFSKRPAAPALCLLAAAAGSRALAGVIQDLALRENLMPWHAYAGLPLVDFLNIFLWPFGFRSTILWRGTRYRLSSGGKAEVL
ncbi:MAG TPA: glycosyltransferase [Elusimicrobiota bacterium]|nr:glycosyltransferase [Elusimicrobiota bacterium]